MSRDSNSHEVDPHALLLDHFINSMPVPVDRDYAESLLERVVTSKVNEGKIAILKEIEPPEQFAGYNRLMGATHCLVCGFDSEKFREWIEDRIRTLKETEK